MWGRGALIVALGLVGCRRPAFQCTSDAECGDGGSCAAGGWCAFPDDTCTSKLRYGEHAGEGLASTCVPVEEAATTGGPMTTAVTTTTDSGDDSAGTTMSVDGSGDATSSDTTDGGTSEGGFDCEQWWDTGWSGRRAIGMSEAYGGAALTDFPAPVFLTDLNGFAPDGADLRFIGPGCDPLAYELESVGGVVVVAWVKLPQVAADAEPIHVYYGNPEASGAEDPDAVWEGSFAAVYHLGNLGDSTAFANDLSQIGGPVPTPGIIGLGMAFDGGEDRLFTESTDSLTDLPEGGLTISAWASSPNHDFSARIVDKEDADPANAGFALSVITTLDAAQNLAFERGAEVDENDWRTDSQPLSGTDYYHLAARYADGRSRPEVELYVDGVLQMISVNAQGSGAPASDIDLPLSIGGAAYASRFFEGVLDEVRISSTLRSPDWIAAENLAGRDELLVIGDPETP